MIWGVTVFSSPSLRACSAASTCSTLTYPYYNLILVGVAIACGAGLAWTLLAARAPASCWSR